MIFLRSSGGWGRHYGKVVGEMLGTTILLLYLAFVFIAAPLGKVVKQERNLMARKRKKKKKNNEKERGGEKEDEIRRIKGSKERKKSSRNRKKNRNTTKKKKKVRKAGKKGRKKLEEGKKRSEKTAKRKRVIGKKLGSGRDLNPCVYLKKKKEIKKSSLYWGEHRILF